MIFDRNLNSAVLLLARPLFFIFINFYVLFCHTLLRLSFSCNHDEKAHITYKMYTTLKEKKKDFETLHGKKKIQVGNNGKT